MPYQTGTATNPANLKSLIETFAQANGWTLTSGVLSRGSNYVRLTAPDTETLWIEGDTDGLFTAGACGQKARIYVEAAVWPLTYRFFSFGSPDFFACVVQYDVTRVQQMWFGSIAKYGSWTGGNWFGACHSENSGPPQKVYLAALDAGGSKFVNGGWVFNNAPAAPWWNTQNRDQFSGSTIPARAAFLHAEIDGFIWPGSVTNSAWFNHATMINPLHTRQPSEWNAQAILLPLYLFMERSQYSSAIGHVERMRTLRIDNFNIGDVLTIGSQKWMIFPWYKKDTTAGDDGVNAKQEINQTGTFGCAIEYDGP